MPVDITQTLKLEFVIDDASIAPDTFLVVDFAGEERISRPFRFEVNAVSFDPNLTLADVANKPATLEVYRDDEQLIFHGYVARFEQGPYVADRYTYTAVLVPLFWYLSLRFQSRIFRDLKAPEIIKKVLDDAGFQSSQYSLDNVAMGDYPVREYCVQYEETDLDFIQRLAEHEGIRYYFEGEKVVFSDKPSGDDSVPKIAGGAALVYNPGGGLQAAAEAVRKFNCREQLVRGKHIVKDHNYRDPETLLEKEMQLNADMPGVHYEYGLHFKDIGEAERLLQVRNEETECQRRVMWGETGYVGMYAGHKMTMEQHLRDELNGEYLLVSVRHEGTQAASVPGLMGESAKGTNVYTNTFTTIPTDVMYRPPRETRVPRIPGIMTGRIEKPGGDYAHIDEEGRYRSRMHFDRELSETAEATHPIRMKQAYSGPGYGIHFPNHAETEMVWACIDGNPDRPMALGTAPNPTQKSPVVAENKNQNIIKTWSGNQMIMLDEKDKEQILIHTPAKNAMLLDDMNDRVYLITTNAHEFIMDDKNRLIVLRTTDGHFLEMNDAEEKITLQSKKGHYLTINDKDDIITIADKDKKHTFTLDIASEVVIVKTVSGDMKVHAEAGNIHMKAASLDVETTGDMTFKAGGNITIEAGGNLEMSAGMNVTSEAGLNHDTKGLQVTSEASTMNTVKGSAVTTVESSGMVEIKGTLVKIN